MSPAEMARRGRGAAFASLAVLSALAFVTVFRTAYRFPFSDDWDLVVPILSRERALDLSWLWAQHNEHRIPIPKLLLIASDAACGGDFRGGVVVNWILLVGVALLLMRAARALAFDARWWHGLLFAALALNPSDNALRWGVELQFVASAILIVVVACATMLPPTRRRMIVAGLATVLLPMTGGNGALFSLAAVAAMIVALVRSRTKDLRAIAAISIALAAIVLALYFAGYRSPANHVALSTRSLGDALGVFAHLVVAPFGPYAARAIALTVPLATAALVAAGVILRRAERRDAAARPIVIAVALVAAGSFLVFGAIAFARGARGWPPGLETHYAPLGIPLWGTLCVALVIVGARALPAVICAASTLAFVLALPTGPSPPHVARGDAFRGDWCAGVPARELADRYIDLLYYVDTPEARAAVSAHLEALRAAPPSAWRCTTTER